MLSVFLLNTILHVAQEIIIIEQKNIRFRVYDYDTTSGRFQSERLIGFTGTVSELTRWWYSIEVCGEERKHTKQCWGLIVWVRLLSWHTTVELLKRWDELTYTTFSSKFRFRYELWSVSGDLSLEIELIDHQNETKVDLLLQLWKIQLYRPTLNTLKTWKEWVVEQNQDCTEWLECSPLNIK